MITESQTSRSNRNYDVVVVGAGSAGVAAACSASKAGAKTLLIERYAFAGGAATAASVLAYCGLYTSGEAPMAVVGGVAAEILDNVESLGIPAMPIRLKTTGNWIVPLNPEAMKLALDRTIAAAGVTVLYHAVVSGVEVVDGRVASIEVSGHFGNIRIAAGAVVDASGEGNVCFLADRSLGHQNANVQPASFPLRIGGIPPEWGLDRSLFRAAAERFNMSKPPIVARENGGVQLRVPGSSEIWWMALDLEANPCDGERFSLAEMTSRECGWRLVECLRQTNAILKDCYLASTGPQIGIRESRRPKTIGRVTAHDILEAKIPSDTVAFGGWPMEIHHAPGVQEYIPVGGQGYFGIPFDAIRTPIANLLVAGRLIGADREAYGSVRVMGTAFATGQAAGVAAAISLSRSGEVDVGELRGRLSKQGALPVLNAGRVA
ncbi:MULTISPECIES: FAD-dependent oxidoreductase [Rhizobium]|uniref:FAD-dependent oxidoreductase n=1 Tax=Rhizobium aouanii TaxID=3118145 RepID=A0ABU8CL85_9HYPH|nr:FAD-dependent oxidoreductase [Rhizobium acaciae]MCW1410808.1 FAD-dependent oxidoreductase [Rhizobium acaciae]MCW1742893.1 FAD-dependent oxidoreductase [Rhizobium acaciae]MCW1750089.1 FAD-dependent oxidoreductase [Rhizobium acaciae]